MGKGLGWGSTVICPFDPALCSVFIVLWCDKNQHNQEQVLVLEFLWVLLHRL